MEIEKYNAKTIQPPLDDPDYSESVEVTVILSQYGTDNEELKGYYDYSNSNWYVHLGGMTVGHRNINDIDWNIEEWYYVQND